MLDPDYSKIDPASFDAGEYMYRNFFAYLPRRIQEGLMPGGTLTEHEHRQVSRARRKATKRDPLLFALFYFPHHLRSVDEDTGEVAPITLSSFHLEMCQRSLEWANPQLKPKESRHAEVAPRESGKSTWNFLIRPAWALAHLHRRYVLAFADMGRQAEQHLLTFKREIQENALLRKDHPALCTPKKRIDSTLSVADRQDIYIAANDVVFHAKGIDSTSLGAKYKNQRPDLLLFDDVEPDASNYSELQKDKRLHTIVHAAFPMNLRAAVIISGTVNMTGALVHDLVRHVTEPRAHDLPEWPQEERIKVHYYPALYQDDDGEWQSIWPQRWPVAWMQEPIFPGAKKRYCDTSSFLLSMQNSPRGADGGWFTNDDFHYGTLGETATRWILQLDPAVTTKEKSDFTGIIVLGCRMPRNGVKRMVEIAYARKVKLVGEPLRELVLSIVEEFPEIKLIRVEANQGGEMWYSALHHMPVKVEIHNSDDPKEVRIARSLHWYGRGRVLHREVFTSLEEDQIGYPKAAHDDLPDAAALAVNYFMDQEKKLLVGHAQQSYV